MRSRTRPNKMENSGTAAIEPSDFNSVGVRNSAFKPSTALGTGCSSIRNGGGTDMKLLSSRLHTKEVGLRWSDKARTVINSMDTRLGPSPSRAS